MKKIIFFLVLVFLSQFIFANSIDSLKTDEDVVRFLKRVSEDFRSTKLKPIELRSTETLRKDLDCDGLAQSWQINNWEKADFNNDGRTDLLVQLYWYDYGVYVVIDKGDGNFKLLTLSFNIHEKCELAKPFKEGNEPLLLYAQKKYFPNRSPKPPTSRNVIDTLVYRYGGFVELNRNPASYNIDSVSFRTGYCFGSCPVFTISFDKTGNAIFDAGTYNPKMGKFSGVIKKENVDAIIGLLNYMSIAQLPNEYKVSWTDDQTCWLRVRFSDGTVKEIKDYGMKGTFGLRLIYSMFFDFRSNQDWK